MLASDRCSRKNTTLSVFIGLLVVICYHHTDSISIIFGFLPDLMNCALAVGYAKSNAKAPWTPMSNVNYVQHSGDCHIARENKVELDWPHALW